MVDCKFILKSINRKVKLWRSSELINRATRQRTLIMDKTDLTHRQGLSEESVKPPYGAFIQR